MKIQGTTTRERVIEEAAKQFYLKGYNATTMRALASAVNIQHPSLFSLYDSKGAIAAVILSKYNKGVEQTAAEFVREHPDEIDEKDARLLVFYAFHFILLYEDKHIAEFCTEFYREEREKADEVIRSLHHLSEEEPEWDEKANLAYRLDVNVLALTSVLLAEELQKKTIRPAFATEYFIKKIIQVRRGAWDVTEEKANRFYMDHWEDIKDTAWKIDVYRDYFAV